MDKISFQTNSGSKYEVYFEKVNKNNHTGKNMWSFGFNSIENKGDVFTIFNNIKEVVSNKILQEKIEIIVIYVQYPKLELEKKTNVFIKWIKSSDLLNDYKVYKNPLKECTLKELHTNLIVVNIDKSKL